MRTTRRRLLGIVLVGALATAAPSFAGDPAATRRAHPTGAFSFEVPAGWKTAAFDGGQEVRSTVVAPDLAQSPKGASRGVWIHLVPIATDENLEQGEWSVDYAESLLRLVHPESTLDRASAQPTPWAGVPATRWTVRTAAGAEAPRQGEFRLGVLRDRLLAGEASGPASTWEKDARRALDVLDGIRLPASPAVLATAPAEPERASAIAARFRASVPCVHAVARRDQDGEGPGGPASPDALVPLNSGTGFVVTADGYVVTNRHVVEHATGGGRTRFLYDPVVLTWDPLARREADVADVIAVGRQSDLALLRIRGTGSLTPMPLANLDEVHEAQQVLVMGWPSVAQDAPPLLHHNWNVIAGLERDSKLRIRVVRHGARTTAGNSGGPVYGLEVGGVLGVHTRGYVSTAHDFQDMFQHGAVPVDRVLWEFPQAFDREPEGTSQEERLARAAFYFRQERFGAATLECRRILEHDAGDGIAHAYLYRIARLQGEPRFAEVHFATAVAQDASRILAHLFAARSAQEEGDVTVLGREAALAASSALALGRRDAETTLMLAHALSNASLFQGAFEESGGRNVEARAMQGAAALRACLVRNAPTHAPAASPLSAEDVGAVEGPLLQSLRMWPLEARAWVYLAILRALQGDARRAGLLAGAAREIGGYDPEILSALAYLHLLVDSPEQALADAMQAARTRATPAASYLVGVAEVRIAALLDALPPGEPRREELLGLLDDLGLTSDAARLRSAGRTRIERVRESVRARMATQMDKRGLFGWWDFAILVPLES